MRANSWVLSHRESGAVICETYSPKIVAAVNPEKVLVESSYDYLCRINAQIKAAQPHTSED